MSCVIARPENMTDTAINQEGSGESFIMRESQYIPAPKKSTVAARAVLYAATGESNLNRKRFGKNNAPVCPSANTGKPSPISFLHMGNELDLRDSLNMYFVAKLKCHASLLP